MGGFGITYRAFDTQLAKFVAIKEYLPVEFAVRDRGKVVARGTRFAEDFAWGRERFPRRGPRASPASVIRTSCLCCATSRPTAPPTPSWSSRRQERRRIAAPAGPVAACRRRRAAPGRRAVRRSQRPCTRRAFLHRDIKPSNIIIRRDGVPVLIDFGAARQAMGERTRTMTGDPHAAILRRSSSMRSTASRARGATSTPPPPCSITPSTGVAAARRRRARRHRSLSSAGDDARPIASHRPFLARSIAPWRSRQPTGRRPSRDGPPCSAHRSPVSPMRRPSGWTASRRPRRVSVARGATSISRRRRHPRRHAGHAGDGCGSSSC
jgi:serine/threonine protein kinase